MTRTASHLCSSRSQLARGLCVVIALSLPSPSLAAGREPSGAQSAEYERLVEEAVGEYRRTHFPEARSLFARAHALYPNARTWRGLGMVEFELRNYVDSVVFLERALSAQAKPLTGELRETTAQLLQRAEAFVGRFLVDSDRAVAISVDGAPQTLAEGAPLTLPVGDHELLFTSAEGAVQRRTTHVRGGEHDTLRLTFAVSPELAAASDEPVAWEPSPPAQPVELAPAHVAAGDSRGAAPGPRRDKPLYKSAWLWTVVGVVAAGAAAGIALAFTLRSPEQREPIAEWPAATLKGP